MEKEHGGTTCSSSGCGAASNTRRYICGPTKALAKRGTRSAVTSTSIIAAVHIRALTATHRIKPTSTRCQSAWWLNLGRCSTYRRGDSVQTAGTSSEFASYSFLAVTIAGLVLLCSGLLTLAFA